MSDSNAHDDEEIRIDEPVGGSGVDRLHGDINADDETQEDLDQILPDAPPDEPFEPSEEDQLFGHSAVELGIVLFEEVKGLRQWQEHTHHEGRKVKTLEELMLKNNIITPNQIKRVKDHNKGSGRQQQIPGYQIIKRIGAGAMATVFKARQESLDRTVAIKVLPKKLTKDKEFVQRFYEEGKAAGKLNHHNIVQAFDVGKAGEYHYFVMELVEGKTVYDYLVENKRYQEKDALDVVVQIAKALKHACDNGFIHRDVKPKNIMLTRNGVAKLADMGLARQVSDREAAEAEAGRAFGTPYYISPEQIRGEVTVDFRCDIYGLGATFYHMVTGQVPFSGKNPSEVMHRHLKKSLVPPDHIVPELSKGVAEVIEVMMAKKPDERYANTADLLSDLEAVSKGEPPLQAREVFSFNDLAALENEDESLSSMNNVRVRSRSNESKGNEAPPLYEQPLFWICVVEGLLIVILIILWAAAAMGA